MGEVRKDAFEYQLDMLQNEFNTLENSINQINTIMYTIKNWAITLWSGSIVLFLVKSQYDIKKFIVFTCIIPLLFSFIDAFWRRNQTRMIYRVDVISKFLNSDDLYESFSKRKLKNFYLLDIRAKRNENTKEFKKHTSLWKILNFNSIRILYGGLFLISIIIGLYFLFN